MPMNYSVLPLTLILLTTGFAGVPTIAIAAPVRSPCVPPASTAPIEFRSETNTLRGFIDLPEGSGRHPAVVMVQGSSPSDVTVDTRPFEELRAAFKRAGIAMLIWDKAGSGCSEGKYSHAFPLRERATEALAAVQLLRQRDDIDPTRIGLWGVSQGAWVAPMTAVRSKDVAFLITVSAPGRDAISQMIFAGVTALRNSGIEPAEVDRARTTLESAFAIARAGGTPEEFVAAVGPLQKYSVLREWSMLDASSRGLMSAVQYVPDWSISADLVLAAVRQPTLAIFGDRDPLIDNSESIAIYRDTFARSGNADLTIRTLSNAGHAMVATPGKRGVAASIFADGYIETMIEWLRAHNFAASEASSAAADR
jgi:pimeloyl-ACP methyl ester carboxylesterase